MQQYFVKGLVTSPVTIEDKETSKHMFQVMRLKEDDEVALVFDDGIKRLARVMMALSVWRACWMWKIVSLSWSKSYLTMWNYQSK